MNGLLYPVGIEEPVRFLSVPPHAVTKEQFGKVQRFIRLNRDTLLEYWHHGGREMFSVDLMKRIKVLGRD